MSEVSYTIRRMRREDAAQALDVWKETGLQEGNHCVYTWFEVDPEGFYVAVTDAGEVIGVCAAVIQHADLAFVGFYAVRKQYRGLGIGLKVWSACMDHVGPRNAALNSLQDKVELYSTRGGFPILETEWVYVVNERNDSRVNHQTLSDEPPAGVDIRPFHESHLPHIFEYDLKLMGYEREVALELNCKERESRTHVAFIGNKCVGFGTIKINNYNAGQIGPLYADDPAVAEVLLRRLIVSLPEATGFAMMTVSTNASANELIKRIGCPVVEDGPRMYRKEKVNVDHKKVFGLFDLNYTPY